MKKKNIFNIVVIIAIAALLIVIMKFGLSEKAMPYMFLVILSFYYLGQYSERILKK